MAVNLAHIKADPPRLPTQIFIPNDYSIYRGLDIAQKQFRLLAIWPGAGESPLKCSLLTRKLEELETTYFALSYCWGDLTDTEQIELVHCFCLREEDDLDFPQLFHVTRSLGGALRRIRSPDQYRIIWADAICINQGDLAERSSQVPLMAEIYKRAEAVFVWLGPGDEESDIAGKLIDELVQAARDINLFDSDGRLRIRIDSVEPAEELSLLHTYGISEDFALRCLASYFAKPWFRRVWVIQEVISAKDAVVLCGDSAVRWSGVLLARRWMELRLEQFLDGPLKDCARGGEFTLPEVWGLLYDHGGHAGLQELLAWVRIFESSDPRDRIYATLNLSNELQPFFNGPPMPPVDYTKTFAEVYNSFTRYLIERHENLNVLSMNVMTSGRSQLVYRPNNVETVENLFSDDSDLQSPYKVVNTTFGGVRDVLPGWVPDFRIKVDPFSHIGHRLLYSAAAETKVDMLSSSSPRYLRLRGVQFDRVRRVTNASFRFNRALDIYLGEHSNGVRLVWEGLVSKLTEYPTGESLLLAFLLTITCVVPADIEDIFRTGETVGGSAKAGRNLPSEQSETQPIGTNPPRSHGNNTFIDRRKAFIEHLDKLDHEGLALPAVLQDAIVDSWVRSIGPQSCDRRRLFVSEAGYIGLGPADTEPGDYLAVLFGGDTPYVLRDQDGYCGETIMWTSEPVPGSYETGIGAMLGPVPKVTDEEKEDIVCKFIGECYVHGKMDGSVIAEQRKNQLPSHIFSLL
ncbi:HET-domain-containing protein [Amniculicola lignicola CBS 123094]|uniref:HET-domain-containing protein n=1 Tax=Amniculicola lignicola CBS 123094 TaxID=1392246 RepID=A0A6A5W5S4_9PLEO|nr:HET-domain-containing protein [Amniculicola lignicola CBS 123094]